jgi:hypothetical protein
LKRLYSGVVHTDWLDPLDSARESPAAVRYFTL